MKHVLKYLGTSESKTNDRKLYFVYCFSGWIRFWTWKQFVIFHRIFNMQEKIFNPVGSFFFVFSPKMPTLFIQT